MLATAVAMNLENAPLSLQASKRIACGADDRVITERSPTVLMRGDEGDEERRDREDEHRRGERAAGAGSRPAHVGARVRRLDIASMVTAAPSAKNGSSGTWKRIRP